MDRLQAMKTYVAVVESGGFTAAARKLDVSLSVVSRVVTELEAHLGVRLLTRTTRLVRPTDTGIDYFENCRRILGEVEEAELSAAGTHGTPRGHLVVTAPTMFGSRHVTPIVVEYLQRYPEVDVTTLMLDRNVNFVDEGVDVAVRIGELSNSLLQAVQVGRVRHVLCASPAYLEAHGTPRTPDELASHVLIQTTAVMLTPEWRFMVDGESVPFRFQPRLATTTNDSAIRAAASGLGIVRVLSYQVAAQLWSGELRVLLAEFEPPQLPIHVVHREGRHAMQKVRAFLDLTIERLRADKSLN